MLHIPLRRRLLAGAVFAVVLTAGGWLAVDARTPDAAGVAVAGQAGKATALASQSGAAANGSSSKGGDGKTDKNGKKYGPGATGGKRSPNTSSPQPAASGRPPAKSSGAQPAPSPAAPAPAPVPPAPIQHYVGAHDDIITTIFWVGEPPTADNANISNAESAWDGNWQTHYGGFDDPDHRSGYFPAAFTPKENPFYFALPYNDLDTRGDRKPSAGNCPNTNSSVSWCKNAWIKIIKGGKTAYAQWQDVGPLQEDDAGYVFGTARPKNTWGAKAGLDVSPAVRDYLGLQDVDHTSWTFVPAGAVPAGPWKEIVTTSPGGW